MSDVQLGRLTLRETMTFTESAYQGWDLHLSGKEVCPMIPRDELLDRFDGTLGSMDTLVAALWEEKAERNGYYTIFSASGEYTDRRRQGIAWVEWKVSLRRHGPDSDVDLETRLAGAVRQNDFSLSGERYHAPPIGHYGYHTGPTLPSLMTRSTADGVITVYRGIPAGISPRWGCAVEDWLRGRVRVLTSGTERVGTAHRLAADQWELSNGLVRVRPLTAGGSLEVAAFTGAAWRAKTWQVDIGSGPIVGWDSASLLRNDVEQCIVRLMAVRSPVGRIMVDVTLRRGSRFAELYVQRGDSGSVSVYLASAETLTNNTSYLVRSTNDANGNMATIGSARSFTGHANGGVTKTSVTALDCYVGVVVGGTSAVSGDQAVNLRDHYIAALPEVTAAVRR